MVTHTVFPIKEDDMTVCIQPVVLQDTENIFRGRMPPLSYDRFPGEYTIPKHVV